jgi:uncharacterized protein (DUF934 family)
MQVIKNQQIVDDSWQYVADNAEAGAGDLIVPLAYWRENKAALKCHAGKIGISISSTDTLDDLAEDLKTLELVELDFPAFTDGRLFSKAWLLRSRYGFQGEIRAAGNYLPSQVFYLSRVGVNVFKPEKNEQLQSILAHLQDFSVKYQVSVN